MINDYLAHHGIKGQKWRIRRYQNKDGSLTAEGRRRYGYATKRKEGTNVFAKAKVAKAAKEEKKKSSSQKPYQKMTDEELRNAVSRLQLEKKYKELTPKEASLGERFMKSMMNDVVLPAAKNAGKAYLEKELKGALGLSDDKDKNKDKDKKK